MKDNLPEEKQLRTVAFIVHASRGVIRDQRVRRKAMFVLLAMAVALLISGATFLQSLLSPREHPGWFVFFWVACAWLAIAAMLLAIFDMLIVKRDQRRAERELRTDFSDPGRSNK